MNAMDLACYILSLEDSHESDITNMKVQKLLYFAQGYYLAFTGKPLFSDEIQAWQFGPVVPAVYEKLSRYGHNVIPIPATVPKIDDDVRSFLGDIVKVYGQYSAAKLSGFTHREGPWKTMYKPGRKDLISQSDLQKFFSTKKEEFRENLENIEDNDFLESHAKSSFDELIPNDEVWKKHSC